MPHQDPPSRQPSPPGFQQRTFTYFAGDEVRHFHCLLPLCFTENEEVARARTAQNQLNAHERAIRQAQIDADMERKREEVQPQAQKGNPCWRRPKTEPLLRVVPTQN